MRLLRAWDKQNKVMHNDFKCVTSGEEGNDWIVFTSDKQPLDSKPHPFDNPYLRQQFAITESIGVVNKQGKNIFEGDIVKCPQGWLGIVNYYKSKACFACEEIITKRVNSHGPVFDHWEELVVLGNLHENPELLDGVK